MKELLRKLSNLIIEIINIYMINLVSLLALV